MSELAALVKVELKEARAPICTPAQALIDLVDGKRGGRNVPLHARLPRNGPAALSIRRVQVLVGEHLRVIVAVTEPVFLGLPRRLSPLVSGFPSLFACHCVLRIVFCTLAGRLHQGHSVTGHETAHHLQAPPCKQRPPGRIRRSYSPIGTVMCSFSTTPDRFHLVVTLSAEPKPSRIRTPRSCRWSRCSSWRCRCCSRSDSWKCWSSQPSATTSSGQNPEREKL